MSTVNRGVQQHGGTSNIGAQAVGDNAQASAGNVHFGTDGTDLLAALREALATHREALPDAEGAEATSAELGSELDKPAPDPGRLGKLLTRLGLLVAPVKPVAEAVSELVKVVQATFGG